jgi:hypothetical protein
MISARDLEIMAVGGETKHSALKIKTGKNGEKHGLPSQ